jgi:hypothetical protein
MQKHASLNNVARRQLHALCSAMRLCLLAAGLTQFTCVYVTFVFALRLQHALVRLMHPLQQALAAAACAQLLSLPCKKESEGGRGQELQYQRWGAGGMLRNRDGGTGEVPHSWHANHGMDNCSNQNSSSCSTRSSSSVISEHLAASVWPELFSPPAVAQPPAVTPAVHAVCPSSLYALTHSQALAWAVGLIAGHLLSSPSLLQTVLPIPPSPLHDTTAAAPHPAQTHAAGALSLPSPHTRTVALQSPTPPHSAVIPLTPTLALLGALLPRAMLPALAARTLLECCLGLDVLEAHVLEAHPPAAANAWLQVGLCRSLWKCLQR